MNSKKRKEIINSFVAKHNVDEELAYSLHELVDISFIYGVEYATNNKEREECDFGEIITLRTDSSTTDYSDSRLSDFIQVLRFTSKREKLSFKYLKKIHDHKGGLSVYWSDEPSQAEIDLINDIWTDYFCESVYEHYITKVITTELP